MSGDHGSPNPPPVSKRHNVISVQLTPIPGSPNATDVSTPPSPSSSHKRSQNFGMTGSNGPSTPLQQSSGPSSEKDMLGGQTPSPESSPRSRSKTTLYAAPKIKQAQSLDAAIEILSHPPSENGDIFNQSGMSGSSLAPSSTYGHSSISDDIPSTPRRQNREIPPSPSRPVPEPPQHRPTVGGKGISAPILNHG